MKNISEFLGKCGTDNFILPKKNDVIRSQIAFPTDFAMDLNGKALFGTIPYWLDDVTHAQGHEQRLVYDYLSSIEGHFPCDIGIGACIKFQITKENFDKFKEHFNIEVKTSTESQFAQFKFGYYPQSYDPNLKPTRKDRFTDKTFKVFRGFNSVTLRVHERTKPSVIHNLKRTSTTVHKTGDFVAIPKRMINSGKVEYRCYWVEPIEWTINNWDSYLESKDDKKTILTIISNGIIGNMYFYPNYEDKECNNWYYSTIRAYLNDINVNHNEHCGGDFSDNGFMYETIGQYYDNISTKVLYSPIFEDKHDEIEVVKSQVKIKEVNPYNFSYQELNNDDLLNLYVQTNTSVFLHGPSGVGKSGRVKQLDPTATRITLRPQMNPEEIDGTLDRETGEYIPPLWYTQLKTECEKEPNRKHILFIDELTNVKPTVQSLIYSIVLDRAGKDGLWPLPDNAVVVAAGNETADNLAAYPLTNALFRRFSHIYYDIDLDSWLEWALCVSDKREIKQVTPLKTTTARIHPAIVAYLVSRGEKMLNQELDEDNPKIVTDPRKWEIASKVLYATNNPKALVPAIGEEITGDFISFTKEMSLTVEDVMQDNYDVAYCREMDISHKKATAVGLVTAKEEELPKVRSFIKKSFGREILATYDSLWVRNDPERAMILSGCQEDEDVSLESSNEEEL